MFTLLEFLYSVKVVEYLIAIGFIISFIVFWLFLNVQPSTEQTEHQERPD